MPAANSFVVLASIDLSEKERLALAKWERVIRSKRALDLYRLLRNRFGEDPGRAGTTALAGELFVSADTVITSLSLLEEHGFVRRSGTGFYKNWEVLPVPKPPKSRQANYRGHREAFEDEEERYRTVALIARLPEGAQSLLGDEPPPHSSEIRLREVRGIVGPPWEPHTMTWAALMRADFERNQPVFRLLGRTFAPLSDDDALYHALLAAGATRNNALRAYWAYRWLLARATYHEGLLHNEFYWATLQRHCMISSSRQLRQVKKALSNVGLLTESPGAKAVLLQPSLPQKAPTEKEKTRRRAELRELMRGAGYPDYTADIMEWFTTLCAEFEVSPLYPYGTWDLVRWYVKGSGHTFGPFGRSDDLVRFKRLMSTAFAAHREGWPEIVRIEPTMQDIIKYCPYLFELTRRKFAWKFGGTWWTTDVEVEGKALGHRLEDDGCPNCNERCKGCYSPLEPLPADRPVLVSAESVKLGCRVTAIVPESLTISGFDPDQHRGYVVAAPLSERVLESYRKATHAQAASAWRTPPV